MQTIYRGAGDLCKRIYNKIDKEDLKMDSSKLQGLNCMANGMQCTRDISTNEFKCQKRAMCSNDDDALFEEMYVRLCSIGQKYGKSVEDMLNGLDKVSGSAYDLEKYYESGGPMWTEL